MVTVIFVTRNVKDVCISWYHHTIAGDANIGFRGTFAQFVNEFRNGKSNYGDYWAMLKVKIDIHLITEIVLHIFLSISLGLKINITQICTFSGMKI